MKNLLIFLSPSKDLKNERWGDESEYLIKIQIESSLKFGWKKEDMWVITNTPFEYMGIKSLVFGDECYCEMRPTATKTLVILEMFNRGMVGSETIWFHDLDAFQQYPVYAELEYGKMALTDYGRTNISPSYDLRLSTGSWFFRDGTQDIFQAIKDRMYQDEINEETALGRIIRDDPKLMERIEKKNITYNFALRRRNLSRTYEIAEKPIKVLHFHPSDKRPTDSGNDNIQVCMYGKNALGKVLMSEDLIKIFNKHGIS